MRRVEIPKKNGKTRPLGLPTWSDKLLQEVMRSLLEAYYEPQFDVASHGFRPGRGCHTALTTLKNVWTGTKWFIEGDIQGYFDNIDHQILLSILREHLHDNRFLRLMENLLKAGYLEDWVYKPTLSGTPQGGIVSPLLANIYLNKFDQWVSRELLPAYNKGTKRKPNPEYSRRQHLARYHRKRGNIGKAEELEKQYQQLPYGEPNDPNYRRLRYLRYADDFLLGYVGTKAEAEEIKVKIKEFLLDELRLNLSEEKTLITHAQEKARFLGYEVTITKADDKRTNGKRSVNSQVSLRLPASVVEETCARYESGGKPVHKPAMLNLSDYEIVSRYQWEYRGYVQYYALAENLAWFSKLHWVMETSLLKTLANKHKRSVASITRQLRNKRMTPQGPRTCIQVSVPRPDKEPLIAYFGGLTLQRKRTVTNLEDRRLDLVKRPRTQLEKRLMAEVCEICESRENIQVHHVRKLAGLTKKGRREKPVWVQVMAAMRRKTLIVCGDCHADIHAGRPLRPITK